MDSWVTSRSLKHGIDGKKGKLWWLLIWHLSVYILKYLQKVSSPDYVIIVKYTVLLVTFLKISLKMFVIIIGHLANQCTNYL